MVVIGGRFKVKPERKLIKRQRRTDAKQDCDEVFGNMRRKTNPEIAADEQKNDAGHEVVDVQSARGLHIPEQVLEAVIADRVGDQADEREGHEKGDEDNKLRFLACLHDVLVIRRGNIMRQAIEIVQSRSLSPRSNRCEHTRERHDS